MLDNPKARSDKTSHGQMSPPRDGFARRVFTAVGITAVVALLAVALWSVIDVLLLIFASILLAIFLRGASDWLSEYTALSAGWSLTLVVLGLVALFGLGGWFIGSDVATQVDQLVQDVPRSLQQLEQRVGQYGWGRHLLSQVSRPEELIGDKAEVAVKATGLFSTTLGALATFVIFLFVGLFLAAESKLYANGLVQLIPVSKRPRAREVLDAIGHALQWWLIGKLSAMTIVGVFTTLGLWLLGVQLALTLGLIAALLTFIPNVGPILAVVPAALLALLEGPMRPLYVVALYLAVQTVESYLLTPLILRHTVSLPPTLTIVAQMLMAVLFGGLGLVLATPLTVAGLVLVQTLYIEDTLGDAADVPDRAE
jgi:predicted PurR-regulated permease PerM